MPGKKPASAMPSRNRPIRKLAGPCTAAMRHRHEAPGHQNARDPDARADPVKNEIARHFEEEVPDEEDAGAQTEGARREPDVRVHGERRVTDVHAVEERHDVEQTHEWNQTERRLREHRLLLGGERPARASPAIGLSKRVPFAFVRDPHSRLLDRALRVRSRRGRGVGVVQVDEHDLRSAPSPAGPRTARATRR